MLQRADHATELDKAPTRLSSTLEMVGGVNRVPSRLSSTLEMVDGLSMVPSRLSSTLEMVDGLSTVGFSTGSPGALFSRLDCEPRGASICFDGLTFFCAMPSCLAQWVLRFDRFQKISVTPTFGHDAVMRIQS